MTHVLKIKFLLHFTNISKKIIEFKMNIKINISIKNLVYELKKFYSIKINSCTLKGHHSHFGKLCFYVASHNRFVG